MDDLEKRKQVYGICGECNEPGTGEDWCQSCNAKRFKKILKIGLVEIKILTNLYNKHNLMLYIMPNILNGYLLKNFKILLILQKVVLVKFIQLNGLKDIFVIGILKIKNGIDIHIEKLH